MRIAYLTARYPFPPIGGDRMRVYYTLRHLLRNHDVTLYTFSSKMAKVQGRGADFQNLQEKIFPMRKASYTWNAVRGFFSHSPLQVELYKSQSLRQTLDTDIRRGAFDLLFVHLIRMAEYARPYSHIPRILDMADSISLHYARMDRIRWNPRSVGAWLDRDRVGRYESNVPKWFDNVLLHTEEDIEWVRKQSGAANLTLSPMGVDLDEFAFRETMYIPSRIIYCGKLDYLPNTDAAVYFAKRIFPYVRRLVPNAQFIVAGFNPPRCLRTLAETPGIEVQANLPDVRPVISSAAVSVAPIRFGAGIQNKILQSLALGVPVVASPLAAGPFSQNGTSPVLVAASPEKFAGLVVRVLQDHEYRMHLARKGRELIETTYGWDRVFGSLDRIIEGHMKVAAKLSRGNLFV